MSRMIVVGRWTRFALLAAIIAAVALLLVSVVVGAQGPSGVDAASPADAALAAEATQTPSPAPEEDPPTTVAALPGDPDRRFLALDGGGVLWRGTAGSCAEGVRPRLERTADAVVWRIATPADAAQLLALTPGDARDQARVVIALADGTCAVAEEVTAADGQSWGDPVATVFDEEKRAAGVLATTPGDIADHVVMAMRMDGCEGVFFTTEGAGLDPVTHCETALDPDDPIAIDLADGRLYAWSGDVVTAIEMG